MKVSVCDEDFPLRVFRQSICTKRENKKMGYEYKVEITTQTIDGENEFSVQVQNNNHHIEKETEIQDFYVKTQIGRNHEKENSL